MTLAFDAMQFAREVHSLHVRKYTGNPYTDHLAEVCGIAMSAGWHNAAIHPDKLMAVCWLHDCVEDQGVTRDELDRRFGATVADGVMLLSDLETGNRATRKKASRERLAMAPGWLQTIKVADLISNTSSIVKHDPKFAKTYLKEKRLMLAALRYADERLLRVAGVQLAKAEEALFATPS